jgi:hypothetical protein
MYQNVDQAELGVFAPMTQPSPLEWETIRPVFENLYTDQGLTLKDVREKLVEDYGFYAS